MQQLSVAQGDGFTKLKRVAFSWNGKIITLHINPQNYSYQAPQRSTTFKTQGDNVNEQFGPDFPVISIAGHTGWKRDSSNRTGADRFRQLKEFIGSYQKASQNGSTPPEAMRFYNYTDGYGYKVTVAAGGFEYSRSVETPLLFNYSISLIVLEGSDAPDKASVQAPDLVGGTGSHTSGGSSQGSVPDIKTQVSQRLSKKLSTKIHD